MYFDYERYYVYLCHNTQTDSIKIGHTNHVINRVRALNRDNPNKKFLNNDKNFPLSAWTFVRAYYDITGVDLEGRAHEHLKKLTDPDSPIGEVFKCSVDTGINVLENIIANEMSA